MKGAAVVANSGRILVRSIEFNQPPFRKLSKLRIDFAERVTLIAGHNGIGKSTILGLLANTFGITTKEPRTYFGESFYTNIEKIVYLSLEEAVYAKDNPTSAPIVVSTVGEVTVRKRSAMTQRTVWNRARVVPRTVEKAADDPVGQDAKVPLPTIFLGLRRLAPIGEADEKDVASSLLQMDEEDRRLMVDFVGSVIVGARVNDQMTQTVIRGAGKTSIQPGFDTHDAMAISTGQDSLGSIATAFASFNRLRREQGAAYQGGLLVIDEVDVGFHPHALERLAGALKKHAKKLEVQVIATTHSPALIECIHPDGKGVALAPDAVVYLLDTARPRVAEDQSLTAILDDMALRENVPQTSTKPKLGVYFEDKEGVQIFDAIVTRGKRMSLSRKYDVTVKPIALEVGGSNLLKLPEHDPIFKDRVLVVDADTTVPAKAKKRGNVVKLPCPTGATGTARSPENMIIQFLVAMTKAKDGVYLDAMLSLNVKNVSTDKILNTFFQDGPKVSTDRESTKKWWNKNWPKLKAWKVIEVWADCHQAEVNLFLDEFENAVKVTSTRLR
ncbi:AAA family ATPase [Stenotrophomonas sp. T8]|uniref:AAA family ATPase n=1 Tax=Stenotrophomonas sp. T8 TaxID=3446365 RepID=UPI003F6EF843